MNKIGLKKLPTTYLLKKRLVLLKKITLALLCVFLFSCASSGPQLFLPVSVQGTSQKLVVFIDGTTNDEASYTNVSKLRNLVTLQARTDIKTAYIEGVGTDFRFIGAAIGVGFEKDIEEAYEFLTTHYQSSANKVYLFGFSRGAYAVRVLAGLLQVAGIPDFSGLTVSQREKAVKAIFNAYKSSGTMKARQTELKKKYSKFYGAGQPPVEIEFVGIWDTVEALGIPDYEEANILENNAYIDQLCNAKRVAHAISLDDDRAQIFTPLLLTKNAAKIQCDSGDDGQKIDQMFFSGAHSDVGGGYADTDIDGVSLNWMLSKIDESQFSDGLVAEGTRVYADPYGKTHDPEADLSFVYAFKHRTISKYAALLDDAFTVHQSVIDRLACNYQQCNEIQWGSQDNLFRHCFIKEDGLYIFKPNKRCYLESKSEPLYQTKACQFKKKANMSGEGVIPLFKLNNLSECAGSKGEVLPCVAHAILIDPKDKHNKSGVKLDSSQRYKFIIKTIDWNDHGACATPERGRRVSRSNSSYLMKGAQYFGKLVSYAPTAGYMELIGEVNGEMIRIGELALKEKLFSPQKTGELILRVNEPRVGQFVYKNNNGSATLFVIRVSE